MFEEVCLVCGKYLPVDGAYCSNTCKDKDDDGNIPSSPALSATSSQYSPQQQMFGYGNDHDVPALVPSDIGYDSVSKPNKRLSVGSSSASSTAWSAVTDDEDEENIDDIRIEGTDIPLSPHSAESAKESGKRLSYARHPSGTNQRATVPLLRTVSSSSSSSSSSNKGGIPRSVPAGHMSRPSSDDDSDMSSSSPSEREERDQLHSQLTAKARRARNRASLPAYFSLLTTASSTSPTSPSTITSASLKIPAQVLQMSACTPPTAAASSSIYSTPRGRARDPRSDSQSSQSSSRSSRVNAHTSITPAAFGHPSRSRSQSRSRQARGRARAEDLDDSRFGYGFTSEQLAPGYGNGRSGLLDRQR